MIPPARWCSVQIDFAAENVAFDLEMTDKSEDTPMWRNLADDVARTRRHISACAPGPARDTVSAYVAAGAASLAHRAGDPDWRDQANLARQLFGRCLTAYSGTARGAKCESTLQRVSHWLNAWS